MEKGRRHHVPAFGEWNYYYHYDEPKLAPPALAAAEWYGSATPEPAACSDIWFKYSQPPRKPASKKMRRPLQVEAASEKGPARRATVIAAGAAKRAATKGTTSSRVVRPVDEDLYQVPPPELSSRRPRRRKRNLWTGCLGLNICVA